MFFHSAHNPFHVQQEYNGDKMETNTVLRSFNAKMGINFREKHICRSMGFIAIIKGFIVQHQHPSYYLENVNALHSCSFFLWNQKQYIIHCDRAGPRNRDEQ